MNKLMHTTRCFNVLNGLTVRPLALAIAVALALPAMAQQAPDAGQNLRQLTPREIAPSRPGPMVALPAPMADTVLPGGATVAVATLRFSGNSVFSDAQLAAALGDVGGRSFDLAGLKGLAQRVSEAYWDAGFLFARAYLPEQALSGGELQIAIVEGRYAKVDGGPVQAWFSQLATGSVIHSAALERSTLVLSDQPGIQISPLMRPGEESGTGELVINATRKPGLGGDVSLDNHGNRYTGSYRAATNLRYDSPFLWGDQIVARLLASDARQWLGNLGYSAPLGATGLRGQLDYSHTAYELGEDFSKLDATGTAKTTSGGLSFPLVRTQRSNLSLAGSLQHKALNDKNGLAGSDLSKSSRGLALTLSFDHRDGLAGGGVSYGALGYTNGKLKMDDALAAADSASGRHTRGHFGRLTLDLARVQNTAVQNLSLFARGSMQSASKNLDSSEGYSLGGANGVRAYPQGEASGDRGWMVQLEARYQVGAFAPYVFHDAGRVTFNADNAALTVPNSHNSRSLAGSGLGLRHDKGAFSVDATLAWRSRGGAPTSDTRDRQPQFWMMGKYRF